MTKSQKAYEPTAGINAMLDKLESITSNDFSGLRGAIAKVSAAKDAKSRAEANLSYAIRDLADKEILLKQEKHLVAELIIDLAKLGCTDELVKRRFKEYNGHDVAEWIKDQ